MSQQSRPSISAGAHPQSATPGTQLSLLDEDAAYTFKKGSRLITCNRVAMTIAQRRIQNALLSFIQPAVEAGQRNITIDEAEFIERVTARGVRLKKNPEELFKLFKKYNNETIESYDSATGKWIIMTLLPVIERDPEKRKIDVFLTDKHIEVYKADTSYAEIDPQVTGRLSTIAEDAAYEMASLMINRNHEIYYPVDVAHKIFGVPDSYRNAVAYRERIAPAIESFNERYSKRGITLDIERNFIKPMTTKGGRPAVAGYTFRIVVDRKKITHNIPLPQEIQNQLHMMGLTDATITAQVVKYGSEQVILFAHKVEEAFEAYKIRTKSDGSSFKKSGWLLNALRKSHEEQIAKSQAAVRQKQEESDSQNEGVPASDEFEAALRKRQAEKTQNVLAALALYALLPSELQDEYREFYIGNVQAIGRVEIYDLYAKYGISHKMVAMDFGIYLIDHVDILCKHSDLFGLQNGESNRQYEA